MKRIELIKTLIFCAIGGAAFLALRPLAEEIRTFLLLIAVECIALGLVALSHLLFRKSGESPAGLNGQIFMGVHICLGLCMMTVYLAQWNI
jgi:hypothetical protein